MSLSLKHHSDTSLMNILPVQVIDTNEISPSQIMVRIALEDGQTMLSRITRHSAVAMGLHEGMRLFAQVKSVSYWHKTSVCMPTSDNQVIPRLDHRIQAFKRV